MVLREVAYNSEVVSELTEEVQQEYVEGYGGRDATPVDAAELAPPHGAFRVVEVDGLAIGCAGLRRQSDDDGEIKRLFVRPPFRRRGYARQLLAELEERARGEGSRRVVLETGTKQPEALTLYRIAGYEPVPPFGHYRGDPLSRCFGKDL